MPQYSFECKECLQVFDILLKISDRNKKQECSNCKCKLVRLLPSKLAVHGTRDSFGIKNAFRDDKTGKMVDTWKKWEKAGFENPIDTLKGNDIKERVKEKIDKKSNKIQV